MRTLKKLILAIILPILNDASDLFLMRSDSGNTGVMHTAIAALQHEISRRPRPERARPEQGGQRITTEWLESLRPRDALYRFRYGSST
ncbi:hypothetical protein R3P38DRAFT_3189253 [Favolaschia claudopus]|uniref:Uncharacterized protein n=1 Tax=Favolaschia claudopus TaxID=2862362 RepID=A0AAW0BS96_9AGAR